MLAQKTCGYLHLIQHSLQLDQCPSTYAQFIILHHASHLIQMNGGPVPLLLPNNSLAFLIACLTLPAGHRIDIWASYQGAGTQGGSITQIKGRSAPSTSSLVRFGPSACVLGTDLQRHAAKMIGGLNGCWSMMPMVAFCSGACHDSFPMLSPILLIDTLHHLTNPF